MSGEQNAPTAELFDFLYRDNDRIASYYAQLFSGNLTRIEKEKAASEEIEYKSDLNVAVAKAGVGAVSNTSEILRESLDPHDMRTVDVLSTLHARVTTDFAGAPNHSILLIKGTLLLVDKYVLELADIAITSAIDAEKQKPKKEQNKNSIDGMSVIKKILPKIAMPSAFILTMENGQQACGTIKESGLEEAISNYYFKHGAAGIPDVNIIGIKELPSSLIELPGTDFLAAVRQAAQALNGFIFSSNAIRVTPVAIFRKLSNG